MTESDSQFIHWFRSAAPYIRVHRGKTFVVQFDDALVYSDKFSELVHDLALLNSLGIRLVLVFGARQSIEVWLNENGQDSSFHHGVRLTDADTMELVKTAAGRLRVEIEARLSLGIGNTPMSNAKLLVSSGNYVSAKPAGIVDGVDYQFTGKVRSVDHDSIQLKLDNNEIVLIPPLGYSVTGEVFNLNSVSLAADLAVALQADKLIYLIEGSGLLDCNNELIAQLMHTEVNSLLVKGEIEESNYLDAARQACQQGVKRVQLIDREQSGAILQELFSRDGTGTMISASSYDIVRQAANEDIPGILALIEPLEKQGVLVERSREKLELEIESFQVMLRDNVIIGCAALHRFSSVRTAELACFAVHPEYHGQAMGEQLLSTMESHAKASQLENIFVLTTQAEHWFIEKGFAESTLEALPVEKKELYNYQRKSRVLMKTLV
ncbi:MAG: amino-acid N-acetyltransferase [Gammaproteobacteria bacterium]|nr:amino-acid N-acetyltransferase [Gammaproteobacteria bacterium]